MSRLPTVSAADILQLIPTASQIQPRGHGGQKLVFSGVIDGSEYAIKCLLIPTATQDDRDNFLSSEIVVRAQREVETMRRINSPHMVRLGPIGLTFADVGSDFIAYFTEEFIDGPDLNRIARTSQKLQPSEVVLLGQHMGRAIAALWEKRRVHRDIKPGNIMRRATGEFVLLDAGLAFDVDGASLSGGPVGTVPYFSPEQFDFASRRDVLDFRSDLFSLGVTMYQLATGQHPFWTPGESLATTYGRITGEVPIQPHRLDPSISQGLSDVIMRLLGKSPHLRYRQVALFQQAMQGL